MKQSRELLQLSECGCSFSVRSVKSVILIDITNHNEKLLVIFDELNLSCLSAIVC